MESAHVRSKGVNETLAMPLPVAIDRRQDAFEALYRSSRDDVYAYVATLLGDRGAAEDVTALAFERAYRRRRTFRADRGSRRAWLFGIARNAAMTSSDVGRDCGIREFYRRRPWNLMGVASWCGTG